MWIQKTNAVTQCLKSMGKMLQVHLYKYVFDWRTNWLPSVIAPVDLRQLLINIQKPLPSELCLSFILRNSCGLFMKCCTCTTLLEYNSLVI